MITISWLVIASCIYIIGIIGIIVHLIAMFNAPGPSGPAGWIVPSMIWIICGAFACLMIAGITNH